MSTNRIKFAIVIFALALANVYASTLAPMPPLRASVVVPGAAYSYRWEGALHVHDSERMRRIESEWPAHGSRRRILAVGDSYTYGYGVDASKSWPAQLADITGDEVLNMGVSGYQSEEILEVVRDIFTPVPVYARIGRQHVALATKRWRFGRDLRPDVIVYAVCLNDLESNHNRWLPWWSLVDSRVGLLRWMAQRIPGLPVELALYANPTRFRLDVAEMISIAAMHGVPMYVAAYDNSGIGGGLDLWRNIAEREIDRATPNRVPFVLPFGNWRVSRWEAHPNAAAHRRFAETIAEAL